MTEKNESLFQQAKQPREELNLPILSFQVADTWIDYLGYEQFGWWLKFHSWVDRTESRFADNHIPRTLESVFNELGVSKANFYKKIKILWECGLIEIVEFEKSERKSQKPKNILVYQYPFHEIVRKYQSLEKLRDWKKDYDSESKKAGMKGALIRKMSTKTEDGLHSETVENSVDNHGLQTETVDGLHSETVENSVDKSENDGLQTETVDGLHSETVTVSKLRPNNYTNNLLINKKYNNLTNNSSLSHTQIDLIQDILTTFEFTKREIERIIELINRHELFDVTKQDIIDQARVMMNKDVQFKPQYFINGLESNIGRNRRKKAQEQPTTTKPVFYDWLSEGLNK